MWQYGYGYSNPRDARHFYFLDHKTMSTKEKKKQNDKEKEKQMELVNKSDEKQHEVKEEQITPVSLDILGMIKTSRTQHGLRHSEYGDHHRYHKYCTVRLHRVRKSLNFLYPRKEFRKKPLEPKHITDPKY